MSLVEPEKRPRSACCRCGCGRVEEVFPAKETVRGTSSSVVRCAHCGLARTLDTKGPADIGYARSYYGHKGVRFAPLIERFIRWTRTRRARLIESLSKKPGVILDVGCGRGIMLGQLRGRKWLCVGAERDLELASAVSKSQDVALLLAPQLARSGLVDGSFDVVTLWHVLEHMDDPGETLDAVRKLLSPSGHLILEVPRWNSFQASVAGGQWLHLDLPRHRYHFRARDIRGLLEKRGFVAEERSGLTLEYGLFGSWQSILTLIAPGDNTLFQMLWRQGPEPASRPRLAHRALTLILLPLAAVLGTALELVAIPFRRGGTIRFVARRPSEPQQVSP